MLVFIPSIGEFVIPELLCGPENFDGWEDTLKGAFQQSRLAGGFGSDNYHAGLVGNSHSPFSSLSYE